MLNQIKFSRNIESEISDQLQDSIKSHVKRNTETKLDSYISGIWIHKPDAEVLFDTKVEKISENHYEIKIHINIDGKLYNFKKWTIDNEDVYSLIDNIFKSIKSQFSDLHHR